MQNRGYHTFFGSKSRSGGSSSSRSGSSSSSSSSANSSSSSSSSSSPSPNFDSHQFWSLRPLISTFMQQPWLKLEGELFTFPNRRYTPVSIALWIPPEYPKGFPSLYVIPNLGGHNRLTMNHPHVGADGRCYLPYLTGWDPHQSSLAELLQQMIVILNSHPALEDTLLADMTAKAVKTAFQIASTFIGVAKTVAREINEAQRQYNVSGVGGFVRPPPKRAQQGVHGSSSSNMAQSGSGANRPPPPPSAPSASSSSSSNRIPESSTSGEDVDEPAVDPGSECTVCLENKKCAFFVPCGHVACCMTCAKKLTSCCICRTPIQQVYRAYV